MNPVQEISASLFDRVAEQAAQSPRRRMNHNFHAKASDNPHRFLNVLLKGTYIRPYRHLDPPKAETFIVLEGEADLLTFGENGRVMARHELGGGRLLGVDLAPGVWHTIVAKTERVVCFEVKPGPWEPASDKEFASWAPAENAAGVSEYLRSLLQTEA